MYLHVRWSSLLGTVGIFTTAFFLAVMVYSQPVMSLIPQGEVVGQSTETSRSDTPNNVTDPQTIIDTLNALGLNTDAKDLALSLNNTGVASPLTIALVQHLQGLAANPQTIDVNQLNRAIAAYNAIVDGSNLATLQQLQQTPSFLEVKDLLETLQQAVEP